MHIGELFPFFIYPNINSRELLERINDGQAYEQSNVMAASREGNIDCKDTDVVWLIAEAKKI